MLPWGMRWLTLIAAISASTGCEQGAASVSDLGMPIDLAVAIDLAVDLSAAHDLALSCVGTPIEGTCVERFFQPFTACFAPFGRCGDFGRGSICWESGATYNLNFPGVSATWSMSGETCLTWSEYEIGFAQYCTSKSVPCSIAHSVDDAGLYSYSAVGGGLYDESSGIFTCPDGTQVNLGSDFGGCPALSALLNLGTRPACSPGDWSCP